MTLPRFGAAFFWIGRMNDMSKRTNPALCVRAVRPDDRYNALARPREAAAGCHGRRCEAGKTHKVVRSVRSVRFVRSVRIVRIVRIFRFMI